MRIIAITPPTPHPDETLWAHTLLDLGVDTLHVRKPLFTAKELQAYLQPLVQAELGQRIVVHSHYYLAPRLHLQGIHITQASKNTPLSPALLALPRSISTHSIAEAAALPPSTYAYAFLSPIYPSISKPGYQGHFDTDQLRTLNQSSQTPIIALGGVTLERIETLKADGFAGLAAIGAFWNHESLRKAIEYTQKLIEYAKR